MGEGSDRRELVLRTRFLVERGWRGAVLIRREDILQQSVLLFWRHRRGGRRREDRMRQGVGVAVLGQEHSVDGCVLLEGFLGDCVHAVVGHRDAGDWSVVDGGMGADHFGVAAGWFPVCDRGLRGRGCCRGAGRGCCCCCRLRRGTGGTGSRGVGQGSQAQGVGEGDAAVGFALGAPVW